MQLATTFLVKVLACLLLLCLCSGAPPRRDDQTPASQRGKSFTRQENQLIISELLKLPESYNPNREKLWTVIAQKFREMHRSGNPGFPQERSGDSIRCHFSRILERDKSLRERLPKHLVETLQKNRRSKGAAGSSSTSTSEGQHADLRFDLNEIPSDSDSD